MSESSIPMVFQFLFTAIAQPASKESFEYAAQHIDRYIFITYFIL